MTSLLGGIGTKGRGVARPDRDGVAGRGLGARLFPYALVAPTLVLLAVFTLFPLVQGFWTSFFKRGLVVAPRAPSTHPVFIGLDNYAQTVIPYWIRAVDHRQRTTMASSGWLW